jgi:ribosome-associated protein
VVGDTTKPKYERGKTMTPKDMALTIAKALDDKKGQDIKVLEITDLSSLADYFVICTATSSTQIKALSDFCEKTMKDHDEGPHHIEGHRGGTWVLMDFSCVIVHIFIEETRQFYDLERLWADAAPLDLSGILTD